jgi:hypothetical protein
VRKTTEHHTYFECLSETRLLVNATRLRSIVLQLSLLIYHVIDNMFLADQREGLRRGVDLFGFSPGQVRQVEVTRRRGKESHIYEGVFFGDLQSFRRIHCGLLESYVTRCVSGAQSKIFKSIQHRMMRLTCLGGWSLLHKFKAETEWTAFLQRKV